MYLSITVCSYLCTFFNFGAKVACWLSNSFPVWSYADQIQPCDTLSYIWLIYLVCYLMLLLFIAVKSDSGLTVRALALHSWDTISNLAVVILPQRSLLDNINLNWQNPSALQLKRQIQSLDIKCGDNTAWKSSMVVLGHDDISHHGRECKSTDFVQTVHHFGLFSP